MFNRSNPPDPRLRLSNGEYAGWGGISNQHSPRGNFRFQKEFGRFPPNLSMTATYRLRREMVLAAGIEVQRTSVR